MMDNGYENGNLTLVRIVRYQIVLAGLLDAGWQDWIDPNTTVVLDDQGSGKTTITGMFDQAALHGALRRFYSIGFPIVSVGVVGESKQRGVSKNPEVKS